MRVLTIGTFDCLHAGHFNLFKECEKLGDVIVGVNTDEFVEKYKGKKPLFSFLERVSMIENFGYTTHKNEQLDGTIKDVLDIWLPNYLVIGSDWAERDYYTQIGITQKDLDDRDITIVYVPYYTAISTTEIKKRYDLCRD